MRKTVFVAMAFGAFASAAPAFADTSTTQAYVSETDSNGNQTTFATGAFGASGVSSFSAISASGPTLSAHSNAADGVKAGEAFADVVYHFHVGLGPNVVIVDHPGVANSIYIPLKITYSGSASITGNGQAVSDLTIRDQGGTAFEDSLNCSGDGGTCGTMGGTANFNLLYHYWSGQGSSSTSGLGEIELTVLAKGYDFGGGFSADAFLDPTITLDPDFAAANPGTTLTVDNVSPAPEPGEWAMMTAGLGIVGAIARRRRALMQNAARA